VVLVGAEHTATITGHGSAVDPVAWHTRLGDPRHRMAWIPPMAALHRLRLTLFDSAGRQLGKQPLNYALGRLHVDLPGTALGGAVKIFPGLADPTSEAPWSVGLSIRPTPTRHT
jgi:hypothetical protein